MVRIKTDCLVKIRSSFFSGTPCSFFCLKKPCIGFQYVKQRVHRLLRHDPVFRQFFITLRMEPACVGFAIPCIICASLLDQITDLLCQIKCLRMPGSPVISRQGIDPKSLAVSVLGSIKRLPIIRGRPEQSSCFPVMKHIPKETKSMVCMRQQSLVFPVFLPGEEERLREKPQDPAVQDTALLSLRIPPEVMPHIACISAVYVIPKSCPERDQSVPQFVRDLSIHMRGIHMPRSFVISHHRCSALSFYRSARDAGIDLILAEHKDDQSRQE